MTSSLDPLHGADCTRRICRGSNPTNIASTVGYGEPLPRHEQERGTRDTLHPCWIRCVLTRSRRIRSTCVAHRREATHRCSAVPPCAAAWGRSGEDKGAWSWGGGRLLCRCKATHDRFAILSCSTIWVRGSGVEGGERSCGKE